MKVNIDGKLVEMKRIGRGTFARVYESSDNTIYAFVPEDCSEYSKEAIAEFASGENVPTITRHEGVYLPRTGYCNVYTMPKYGKLTGGALQQAKQLNTLWRKYPERVWRKEMYSGGYQAANYKMLESWRAVLPVGIYDSIISILEACANYGDTYTLEFPLRNMMQTDDGRLVLLDIAFNVRALPR